jgi:hypothetical protein
MARVRERVSSSERPRSQAAMSQAESCSKEWSGNGARGCAGDEEGDFARVEGAAVALFADQVDGVEGGPCWLGTSGLSAGRTAGGICMAK